MTKVEGRVARRELGLDSFADLTTAPVVEIAADGVTFDGDIDEDTADAIRERMTSRDDDEQTARTNLTALRTTAASQNASSADVKALVLALSAYILGD